MNTAQVKQAIKKSAQQIRQEPLELLKSASRQITGEEERPNAGPEIPQDRSYSEIPQNEEDYKIKKAEQDGRHLQALETELKDIRRQKLFNELLKRIQAGEDVPIEEFTELSYEQKDVLKAHLESFQKSQITNDKSQNILAEPEAKRGRKMGGGQKGAAKKEQTRVEKPVPPSG